MAEGLHDAVPNGGDPAHPYAAEGFTAVQEQITTVGEEVSRVRSAALMRRFKWAVSAFIILSVLVLFLPAFVSPDGSFADSFCRVTWNLLRLVFLLGMAWVFRPQEDSNTYLQLGTEEGQLPALETHVRALRAALPRAHARCR